MPLLVAGLALLLAGTAASVYLHRIHLPRERRAAGMVSLAQMDWDSFAQLVLAVLNARGFERAFGGSGTDGEYLLQRGDQNWLMSSNHARAYVPGSTAFAEFGNHLRHRGIHGGILAIPGIFPPAAAGLAHAQRIELLDSANMWDELQSLLRDDQLAAIERPARAQLRRKVAMAWLVAAALAVATYLLLTSMGAPLANEITAVESTPAAIVATVGTESPAASAPQQVHAPAQPLSINARRPALAKTIGALPYVTVAGWATDSTLLVKVDNDAFDPRAAICPLLEHDPELGASRLQIQYPTGSDRPIRFLQCRPY
ncbi:MAG: restriction endonuclease [Luteimonas sp.]